VLIEVFLCFPALFFVLTVAAFVGDSAFAVISVLGLVYWTSIARIVRGELLSLRGREFVQAARGLGVSTPRLLLRHLLPCVVGPVMVNVAFLFAGAVIVEATLSFLGLGSGDDESWGTILAQSKEPALRGVWHLWVFPTLAVAGTVWSLHALADRSAAARRAG
jgi:peptide/nickel transport system permease protein